MAETLEFENFQDELLGQPNSPASSVSVVSDACWQAMRQQPAGTNFHIHSSRQGYVTAHASEPSKLILFSGEIRPILTVHPGTP